MNKSIFVYALLLAAALRAALAQATFTIVTNSPIAQDASYGMSWVDYDNDGFIDLHSCGPTRNLLYHNNGNGTFTRVPSTNAIVARTYPTDYTEAGYWADYDNDGLPDVIIPTGQQFTPNRNQFFRNLGDGRFVSVNNALSTHSVASMSAAWGDFNRDGILDVFLANVGASKTSVDESQFYLGSSDGSFERLTGDGIPPDPARRFAATVADSNNDGWPDLAVGTNPGQSIVLHENRNGSAFDVNAVTSGGRFILGAAWGDYDNDRNMDLFAAYTGGVCKLLRNDGNGAFEQIFDGDLPQEPGRAYAAAWGDYDNDGWLDLFVPRTSFYVGGTDNSDSLWRNNGDGTFTRVSPETIGNESVNSWGGAWGDFNNDGFLDLAVGRQDSGNSAVKNRLFQNNGNPNHWIEFKLAGTVSNRSAVGAKVRIKATIQGKTFWQMREIGAGAVNSQNDLRAHFGVGNAPIAEMVRIEWPSGLVQELSNIPANQFLTITEPDDRLKLAIQRNASTTYAITIYGPEGTTIALERSPDLLIWTEIVRPTIGDRGWVVEDARNADRSGFFRAIKR